MSRIQRYVKNVLWTWAGVAVNLMVGLILSPYIIRHIGATNYGVWTLVLSLVEYYWLIDLGFRSATLKFSAEYGALDQQKELEELLNTGLVYSSLAGLLVILVSFLFAPAVASFFHVGDSAFPALFRMVGLSWAFGLVFNVFSGCLEGFQCFDILSRIWILTTVFRSVVIFIALQQGHGVMALGWVLLAAQAVSYLATWIYFRRTVHSVRFSPGRATRLMLSRMTRYGVHTLTAHVGTRLLNFGVPVLTARFLPVQFLAYWSVPVRIMDYATDGIGRIGMVTTPNATELMAKNNQHKLVELGVLTNRYCLALFLPVATFLLVYGKELYLMWLKKPDFVQQSAFLIPILLIGYTCMSGQANSVSILFGIGKHRGYVRFLLAEAILTMAGLAFFLPRYGLAGGAWTVTTLMTLDRCIIVGILTARELRTSVWRYFAQIYTRPLLIAGALLPLLYFLKLHVWAGRNWFEIIGSGSIFMLLYVTAVVMFCLAEPHRTRLLEKLTARFRTQVPASV